MNSSKRFTLLLPQRTKLHSSIFLNFLGSITMRLPVRRSNIRILTISFTVLCAEYPNKIPWWGRKIIVYFSLLMTPN